MAAIARPRQARPLAPGRIIAGVGAVLILAIVALVVTGILHGSSPQVRLWPRPQRRRPRKWWHWFPRQG